MSSKMCSPHRVTKQVQSGNVEAPSLAMLFKFLTILRMGFCCCWFVSFVCMCVHVCMLTRLLHPSPKHNGRDGTLSNLLFA